MTLSLSVRGSDYYQEDHDHDSDNEDEVLHIAEFEQCSVIVENLSHCLLTLSQDPHNLQFSVISSDYLLEHLENGGEIECSEIEDLAEEISQIQDKLDSVNFQSPTGLSTLEFFLEELNNLVDVCRDAQSNIEIFNNELSESIEDEDDDVVEDDSPESLMDSPEPLLEDKDEEKTDQGDENFDDFDEDLDPELEEELMHEFQMEFGSEGGEASSSPLDSLLSKIKKNAETLDTQD